MWVSPKFNLQVIRAYDALVTNQFAITTQSQIDILARLKSIEEKFNPNLQEYDQLEPLTQNKILIVPFNCGNYYTKNDHLYLIDWEGKPYVPMRPIMFYLGLQLRKHSDKIRTSGYLFDTKYLHSFGQMDIEDNINKNREAICISLYKLSGWLYSLKGPVLNKLSYSCYREHCVDTLVKSWNEHKR